MADSAPPVLGRSVVVNPGGPVPEPWASARRVVIDPGLLGDPQRLEQTVTELQRGYVARVPAVFQVDPAVDLTVGETTDLAPHLLGGRFSFLEERLLKAVWHNSYDARNGDLIWWWAHKAARLDGVSRGGPADVVLDDGAAAWIDGGPRQPLTLDDTVIHHESVEVGRVAPVPGLVAPTESLAPDQLEAVSHLTGPARVIAPAGSGKTRVLTARMRHLIDDRKVEPELITALAYNNRAAEEMRSRLPSAWARSIRTIHSLALEILREARPGVEVIDEMEARARLRPLALAPPRPNTDVIAPYLDALDDVRVGLFDPAEVEGAGDDVPGFAVLFAAYRQRLLAEDRADFGEMIYGAIEALCSDPRLRARWQGRCRHLLVDEFQDLTPGYLLLIRLLAAPGMNVFGVGDDDQVIYGYQGADPGFLIGFEELFPGATVHALEVNYRCPRDVVGSAANLLSHNRRRVEKTIRSATDRQGLELVASPSRSIAGDTVERVRTLTTGGALPADIAVLARVNSALLPVHVALAEERVPFRSDLTPEVLRRTLLAATMAWMRVALEPERIGRDDLFLVIRRPARGLVKVLGSLLGERRGPFSIEELYAMEDRLDGRQAEKWAGFCDDMATASRAGPTTGAVLEVLSEQIGLQGSAEALDSGRSRVGASHHGDDLTALLRVAPMCPSPAEFEGWLKARLGIPPSRDGVLLSSVHKVKGLEWDHVIVFGADRDTMPHRLSDDVEEERRVFHVALTRGVKTVTVVSDDKKPSPFLGELAEKAGPGHPVSARPAAGGPSPGGRGITVEPGDEIMVTGGYRGRVESTEEPGVTIRLSTGAAMTVSWGDRVRKGGDAGRLVPARGDGLVSGLAPDEAGLAESLRSWRREKARALEVPAYLVFNDKTLEALVQSRPSNERQLLAVPGIGPAKLEAYGDELLELLSGG